MTLAQPPVPLHRTPEHRRLRPGYDHHPAVEGALWLAWTVARYTKVVDLIRAGYRGSQRLVRLVERTLTPDTLHVAVRPNGGRPADWRTRGLAIAIGALALADLAWLLSP
jgi:hypothetical protein